MISIAKETAYLLEGELSVLTQEIHHDVTSLGDGLSAAGPGEAVRWEVEVAGYAVDDSLW